MKTYELVGGNRREELNELDLKYLAKQVKNDLKYQRSRSATRQGDRGDANHSKVQNRQRLLDKLNSLLKE